MQPKRHKKDKLKAQPAVFVNCPIEQVSYGQHKTVLIIFPLNLQTITIALYVFKWRGGGHSTTSSSSSSSNYDHSSDKQTLTKFIKAITYSVSQPRRTTFLWQIICVIWILNSCYINLQFSYLTVYGVRSSLLQSVDTCCLY